jgi:hypothetical protein
MVSPSEMYSNENGLKSGDTRGKEYNLDLFKLGRRTVANYAETSATLSGFHGSPQSLQANARAVWASDDESFF